MDMPSNDYIANRIDLEVLKKMKGDPEEHQHKGEQFTTCIASTQLNMQYLSSIG